MTVMTPFRCHWGCQKNFFVLTSKICLHKLPIFTPHLNLGFPILWKNNAYGFYFFYFFNKKDMLILIDISCLWKNHYSLFFFTLFFFNKPKSKPKHNIKYLSYIICTIYGTILFLFFRRTYWKNFIFFLTRVVLDTIFCRRVEQSGFKWQKDTGEIRCLGEEQIRQ